MSEKKKRNAKDATMKDIAPLRKRITELEKKVKEHGTCFSLLKKLLKHLMGDK